METWEDSFEKEIWISIQLKSFYTIPEPKQTFYTTGSKWIKTTICPYLTYTRDNEYCRMFGSFLTTPTQLAI